MDESVNVVRKQQSTDGNTQSVTHCGLWLGTNQWGQVAAGWVLTETIDEEWRQRCITWHSSTHCCAACSLTSWWRRWWPRSIPGSCESHKAAGRKSAGRDRSSLSVCVWWPQACAPTNHNETGGPARKLHPLQNRRETVIMGNIHWRFNVEFHKWVGKQQLSLAHASFWLRIRII